MPLMAARANRPELELLLRCARLSPDITRVRECAAVQLDWTKVVGAAEYHGLTPLLLKNLVAASLPIPEQRLKQLEQNNARAIRQNLFLTSELLRAVSSLSESGIQGVPLKGSALATRIYGDIGLRPFTDIDLLIRREQLTAAEAIVLKLGYEAEVPIPAAHRNRWLKQQCELTFRRANVSRLELHWDISHPHFALHTGVDDFWSRLRTVQLGDAKLTDLSEQDLLFTLIVHGTRHAWSRLMWVVDLAELLRSSPKIDWQLFAKNARDRGAERMVATALVLVRKLFDISVASDAMAPAYVDPAAAKLAGRIVAHWNTSLAREDVSELEPSPMWRHRW